jgi:putative oxidoreductase
MNNIAITLGRLLLGLYFLVPGITKITGYAATADYMALHNIPMVGVLLPITIVLQVGGGLSLMAGYLIKPVALVLAALTLAINVGMHDFWVTYSGVDTAHELQNFIKNLGIFAGLLVLASAHEVDQWRLQRSKP